MATTTNYGWTTPDDTALVKDGAAAIRTLGSSIDTSLNTALGTKKAGLVLLNTTSFSGVSSQSINSVFNSTYDNYHIVLSQLIHSVGGVGVKIRLRKSGTDNSSNIYIRQYLNADNATLAGQRVTDTSFFVALPHSDNTNGFNEFTLFNPNNATVRTGITGYFTYNALNIISQSYVATHNLATSADFDGFTLLPDSGTITGNVSVYGYNK
jgi:hypothetical protein